MVQLSNATNGTSETVAATEKAVADAYSKADGAASAASVNGTSITKIINGTTKVGAATSADNATNAGHANTAGHATSADSATSATKASQDAKGNTIDTYYATVSALAAIESKISNAMHFLGITSTELTDGSTTNSIEIKGKNITLKEEDAGAVVLTAVPSATGIQYEYVWTGTAWGQLGQEGSFAVKGSITNTDINASAAIAQAKIASTL